MNTGLYLSLGGEYVNEEGAPVAFEPENCQVWNDMFSYYNDMFSYYIGLVENDLIPASAVANDQTQQMPDVYAGDIYSFAGNSNFHVRQLQPNLPEEEYANWSATPLPIPDAADPAFPNLYQAGGWIIGAVASGDPEREAAAAAWTLHATNGRSLANTCKAGASQFRTIWQILLPSLVPGLAALLILQFIGHWNDFVVASVLLRDPNLIPLTVGTFTLIGPDESDFRLLASASLVNIVPVLGVFSILQRYLVSGLAGR